MLTQRRRRGPLEGGTGPDGQGPEGNPLRARYVLPQTRRILSSEEIAANAGTVMLKRILAPIDLSEISIVLVQHASDLARQTGAELVLLLVYSPEEFEDAHRDEGFALDEYVGAVWSTMRDYVREAGGPPETRLEVVQGWSIPEQILAAADRLDVQLILMGTHGWTGLRRLVLGSVAEEVLRHATVPVFVVPLGVHARIPIPAGVVGKGKGAYDTRAGSKATPSPGA